MVIFSLLFGWAEQADQAEFIERVGGSPQRTFRQSGLLRTHSRQNAVQGDRSTALLESLFWMTTPLLDQFPVVRSFVAFTFRSCHGPHPSQQLQAEGCGQKYLRREPQRFR